MKGDILKPKAALIFDLDGVVVLTDRHHYMAWKKLTDEHNWEFDESVNHLLRGVPRLESLRIILRHNQTTISPEREIQLMEQKNIYFQESLNSLDHGNMLPGVKSFIVKCREAGHPVALCSASRNARRILDHLNIHSLFDVVVTSLDVERSKPAPDMFLLAAEKLEAAPGDCWVFEDGQAGIDGAKAAGMNVVGIGHPDQLSGMDLLIEDFTDQRLNQLPID